MIRVLSHCCSILAMLALATSLLCADEGDVRKPRVVKLTLSPSAPARPVLLYQLQIEAADRLAGNAAPCYSKAILLYQQNPISKEQQQALVKFDQEWSEKPCEGETREQIRAWVNQFPPG